MTKSFPLAPMSGLMLALTVILLAVPVALLWAGIWPVALIMAAIYASVWFFMRPTRFTLGADGLTLEYPVKKSLVARSSISGVSQITGAEFKARFGFAARVGAGGLWGGFGWLWTSKEGFIDFFISRTDGYVLIERVGFRPLLITPADPAEFVRELRELVGGS